MKYPLLKNVRSTNFLVVSETLSLPKCRDAFSRLGEQVYGIISLIAKALQFAETQKCVSTIFPRTYIKKIVVLLFLAFTAATQAVGQITFTPSTNINPKVYDLDAVAEGNSVSASFASLSAQIKSDLGISNIYGGQFYMRWFVRGASETGYENAQKNWKVSFSFTGGKSAETKDYGMAWFSDGVWSNEESYYSAAISAPDGVDSKDYQIVCLITDNQGYTFQGNVLTETNIKIAVVFNIKTLEDVLADYRYPDLGSLQKFDETIVFDNDAATIDLSLTDYKDEIHDYNNIKYLHLYLTDKEGRVIPGNAFALKEANTNQDTKVASSVVGYHLYYTNQYYGSLFGEDKRAQYVVTKPDGYSWENLRVVAVFANSIAGMGTYGDYVISEPSTLTAAATFTFITLEDVLADYPYPDLTSIQPIEKNLVYDGDVATIDLSLTDYRNEIPDYDNIKYLHLYLTDKEGRVIPGNAFELKEANTNPNTKVASSVVGYHLYHTDPYSSLFSDDRRPRFVITKPDGYSWENLRVVAVFANSIDGMGTYGDYVISEPSTLTAAATFTFITLEDVLADYPYPDLTSIQTIEKDLVYDGDAATIDLSLTDYRNEIPDYNNIKYLHLYLTDKEGKVIPSDVFALKETNTDGNLMETSSNVGYHLYYTDQYWDRLFRDDRRARFVITKPDGYSWGNLRVVAVFANSIAGMGTYGDYVISEPSTLTSAFVFSFKSLDESLKDYTLPDVSLLPTHEVNVWYEGGTTSAVLDFFSHKDQINTDYNGGTFQQTKYLHFYVVNENGEAISDIYDATFTPVNHSYPNRSAVPTPFGWYVYANGDNAIFSEWGQSDAQFTFSKPDNLDWTAIKVVAVLTDDVTGWEMNSGYVLKNPEQLKSAFVFTFKKMGFRHYEGIANKPGEWDEVNGNKMQLTHEWTYDKYVKPGEIITLTLPMRFDKGPGTPPTGDDWEPQGYFRWYNYQTDAASTNLSQDNYGMRLVPMFDAETDENKGLFQWDIYHRLDSMRPTPKNVAAIEYKAPASNWNGEAIACDVSRYIDGVDPSSRALLHEPTLSIRYIYNVYPAQKIADDIMNAMIYASEAVYEDNGYMAICTNAAAATDSGNQVSANLRLKLQEVGDYYFYPYAKCDQYGSPAKEPDFDQSGGPIQATKVIWRVFTALGSHYKDLQSTTDKMYALSLNSINNNGSWTSIGAPTGNPTIYPGDRVYVVAYLSDESGNRCPVARFNCRFYANTPPLPYTEDESASSLPEHRKLSYLRQNYNEVAVLNFDNDSPESTLAAPTNALDNMTEHPSQWSRRFYGFVYKDLYNQNDNGYLGLSPKHGDYGLYKSMNVPGVSVDQGGDDGYQHEWYYTSPFYDRTYEMTHGSQSGYFLYVDASEEARQIAAINFDGELCAGSTVVISAAVADLTDAATKPQLLFKLYGITENASGEITDRKLIHSFATGNFSTFGLGNEDSGKWYQVYLKSTLQHGTGVENFHKFLVVIDNYCDNTEGADYAIDDIRIYTRNSSVEVAQTSIPCEQLSSTDTPKAEYKVKILHETLIAWLNAENNWIRYSETGQDADYFYKYFYYRLCKADGTPAEGITYRVANKIREDYTTSQDWGRCRVFRSFTNKPGGIDNAVYEYDEVNNLYYIIVDDLTIPVPVDGEKYYVSLCWPQLGNGTDKELEAQLKGPDDNWGTPIDICSAYSSLFEAIAQQPSITDGEGNVVGSLTIPCNGDPQPMELRVQLIVPDPVNGGTYTLTGDEVMYNWFVVKDGTQKKPGENVSTYSYTYNAEDISDDGKLHLRLVPVTTHVTINGDTLELCANPMDLALDVRTSGPQLELGFKDVTYQENTTRTVRVGLRQLESMRNEGKKLALPVHSYENMVESEDFHLAVKEENGSVAVVSTNDPTWTDITNREIGKVTDLTAENAIITIDIPEGGGAFHEGYAYDLSFQFYDEEHDKTLTMGQETCYGDAFFTLKIVPEYVTWTGAANEMMSTNWNNDQNWARSLQEEIYKGNDYTDYGQGDYAELTRQQAYVPMKFTKVTLPDNMQSPRLAELGYSGEGIINNGLLNEFSYDATEDIEYDLMVRIDKDLKTDYNDDGKKDYDCEKFYGNTCQEIYFKPQAELRHQEELVYERAWVEYEFQANKWQLLTSPLKNVYSGDMYVPKSNGRQETEAFKDIKFDGGASGIYSRVGYPIYQRSWDKTGSMVVVSKEDDYRNDYPADIVYGSWDAEENESAVVLNQWSHSYNDATVAYAPGDGDNGFSLRAHKRDQHDQRAKALIRLPKADISYTYYNIEDGVEDEKSGGHDAVVKDDGNKHNLLADAQTEGDYAPVTMTLDNHSEGNDIYLVSNPYMASLDMNLFFEANADVCRKLWTIVDGEVKVSPTESGVLATIAPGQAFFIKVPGGNVKEVKFTTNMVTNQKVDFNGNLQAAMAKFTEAERRKRAQQALVMTARSDGKKSTAIVRLNTEADEDFQDREDVETLYDSNLTDVPTLYTIAGDQAVSVNSLPAIGAVPLGIVCATDTQAEVTFSGVSDIPGELYLYDRETGSSTLLSDSVKLHLQANAHGRYFLTGQRVTSGITNHEVKGIRCYSPAPGQLTIACLDAGNQLERVDIYTIDGKKEYSNNDINAPALTIHTHRGVKVVVIKHTGKNYAETEKVAVN